LKGNGADPTKIRILDGATLFSDGNSEGEEVGITLARLDVLEVAINAIERETGLPCRMIVVDPISNFWGSGVNENSQSDVRPILFPLQQFFQKRKIAPILIQHLRKSSDCHAMLRITGSIAISGTCRNLWGVYTDPQDTAPKQSGKKRFLVPYPGNVCLDPTGISFLIVPPDGRIDVVDCGIEKTGNDFEAAWQQHAKGSKGRPPEALTEAVMWLQDFLAVGERPAKEIYEAAEANGIKKRTLGSAKKELDVKVRLEGFGKDGIWYWSLPLIALFPDADNSCNLCEEPRDCKNAENDEMLENKGHEQK
jgi:hypothetical protein